MSTTPATIGDVIVVSSVGPRIREDDDSTSEDDDSTGEDDDSTGEGDDIRGVVTFTGCCIFF